MDDLPPRTDVDHTPGRAQHWSDVDADLGAWIRSVVEVTTRLPGHRSTILHGSLSTGTFVRPKSDVDVLVIVEERLADDVCWWASTELVAAHDRRPIIGGLELSVMASTDLDPVVAAPRYELHVGESCADEIRSRTARPTGTDPDLPAHLHHARHDGVALAGDSVSEVIPPMPTRLFLDAVESDLRWILEHGLAASPYYGILNICRVAQLRRGASDAPTKAGAATWALEALPVVHRPLIAEALECYRSAAEIDPDRRRHHGHRWDLEALDRFARWATDELLPSD